MSVSVARHAALLGAVVAVFVVACAGPDAPGPTAEAAAEPLASSSTADPPAGSPAGSPGEASPTPTSPADSRVITHGPPGHRRITLTFDSNMTTAMLARLDSGAVASYANTAVVDELEQRKAPATFFLSGLWVQRYPELTRRIAADPRFELASHSYAHLGFTPHCYGLGSLPPSEMAADVQRSFAVLAPFGGRQTRYFRFPGGCYDATALRAIAPAHATVIQYDDVGGDAFTNDPAAITAGVLRQAHDGGIIVMHITKANAPRTADALPAIIDQLRQRGYQLVPLSDLLHPPAQLPKNLAAGRAVPRSAAARGAQ